MFNVNPFRAVQFKQSAIEKALAESGSLVAETKYDGVRGNIVVQPLPTNDSNCVSRADVYSRSNKPIPALAQFDYLKRARWAEFQRDFMFPEGFILDGELMVKGETFQKSSGILRRKTPIEAERLMVIVYDCLPIAVGYNNDDFATPWCVRRMWSEVMVERLKKHFPEIEWKLSEQTEIYSMDDLLEHYKSVREAGHEGLIVKDPLGGYRRGKKSGWFKLKPEVEADGHVIGYNWGTEGLANEGKIIGFEVLSEDGHIVNANGITKAQMEEFTNHVLSGGSYMNWAVQFKFMERCDEGGFRHPSFDCWRGTESDPTVKV